MNIEQIEAELSSLNTKNVIIVRPNFGKQSDSWQGILFVYTEPTHIKFEMVCSSGGFSMIFEADDVIKIELNKSEKIIRLKGPQDYINLTVNA